MANLEIGIGADISDLQKGISKAEKELKKLEKQESINIKAGLDTSEISKKVADAKKNLDALKSSMNSLGNAANGAAKPIANASNTLTNFSRIAQDAPFGIMGIGNNLTATAEAFAGLSKQAGGAGNALKAVGASLLGGGGVLLAISLVTTALTVMSQKGITVGDVFDKLSGNFNQFKKDLSDVNKEAAKNSAEEVQRVKSLAEVAKDETLTRQKRLVAVQKLQDEYPAYFANLSKEQILNGNVGTAINDVVAAIKEKARAQALSGKLGDLALKEFDLREKETDLINKSKEALKKKSELEKQLTTQQFNESTFKSLQQVSRALDTYQSDLKDVKKELGSVISETDKWANESAKATKKSILLEFKPEKVKKIKFDRPDIEPIGPAKILDLNSLVKVEGNLFTSNIDMGKQMDEFISRLQNQAKPVSDAVLKFSTDVKNTIQSSLASTLGSVGDAIGEALANGGNVISAIGSSLINSMGKFLSDMGGMLIEYGALAVAKGALDQAIVLGGPASVAAGLAAIGVGVALKAAGGAISGLAKKGSMGSGGSSTSNVSAGNSVTSPTSSVNSTSSGGGWGNVVFEISGQSLVGVLSNTLNKNTKLGGVPAI